MCNKFHSNVQNAIFTKHKFSSYFKFACQSEPCTDEPNWLRELAHKQTYSSETVYGERRDNEQRKLRVVGMALCNVNQLYMFCINPLSPLFENFYKLMRLNLAVCPTSGAFSHIKGGLNIATMPHF